MGTTTKTFSPHLESNLSADDCVGNEISDAQIEIQYPIRYTRTKVHDPLPSVLEQNRVIGASTNASISYAYKILRTQVVRKIQSNGWNSIAVLAARSGEGATLTAVNLAISIAMDPRHTVLLVDLNFKRPAVHRYFGYQPEVGIEDILLRNASLEKALFNPGVEGLLVLPCCGKISGSSELLNSKAMMNLIVDIKSRYHSRIVILDLPPLLEADDALACSAYFDAGLLVLSEGASLVDDLAQTAKLLDGKPLLGSVFNNAT